LLSTTVDPRREGLLPALTPLFPGATIAITYSLSADIDQILSQYQKPLETRFSKILDKKGRMAPEFLGEIFSDALAFHASDIHFEPQEGEVLIRFRVDGVLQDAGRLPREHYENILNRIKVQSRLRIDEHFSAQDGSLRYEDKGTAVDFRTSIVPTVEGEKIVLRILAAYVRGFSLEDLGLSPDHQEILSSAPKPIL
jgi:type II secretory ATPase GspE/PulE/Tfp pilus assembly ATPase PilB-like protein